MNSTQSDKLIQIKPETLVVGVDVVRINIMHEPLITGESN